MVNTTPTTSVHTTNTTNTILRHKHLVTIHHKYPRPTVRPRATRSLRINLEAFHLDTRPRESHTVFRSEIQASCAPGVLRQDTDYKSITFTVLVRFEDTLWNPRPVEITGHPGRNPFLPVFQGVDGEKPIQAFFPVFCPGIFLPGCRGYFASATNAWFQPGFFSPCHNKEFFFTGFPGS